MLSQHALLDLGFSSLNAFRAQQALGSGAARTLIRDPYAALAALGWEVSDALARRQGLGVTDPRRLRAQAVHVLLRAATEQGQTCLPVGELTRRLGEGSVLEAGELHAAAMLAADHGDVQLDLGRVYLPVHLRVERGGSSGFHERVAQ